MVTATTTVTINAAFLQEIKEDFEGLHRLLSETELRVVRLQPPLSRRELAALLGELRDQLALHFALEEAYGYFDDALGADPYLSRRAEALRGEHRQLFLEICRLEERAEQLLYHEPAAGGTRSLTAGYTAFYRRFLDHESRENALILESLAEEMGDDD